MYGDAHNFVLQSLMTYQNIIQQFMFCSSVCGLFICLSKTRINKSISYISMHNAYLNITT